ncbi:MAG: hypothetical protein ACE5SW_01070 [Nitrososphaeraceae archaeon]
MSDVEILNELRDSLHLKRKQLNECKKIWENVSNEDINEISHLSGKTFVRLFEILNDLYKNLEAMYILNAGIKNETDMLRDIIIELPDVKNNPQTQNEVNQIFLDFSERFMNIQKSFSEEKIVDMDLT